MSSEERDRFARLKYYLEDHSAPEVVIPGSAPDRRLEYLARHLSDGETKAVLRQFDNAAGRTRIPAGAAMLEKMAKRYLPEATSAL